MSESKQITDNETKNLLTPDERETKLLGLMEELLDICKTHAGQIEALKLRLFDLEAKQTKSEMNLFLS